MKNVAIVQARMGSRRFPGKVLQDLGGRPVLAHVVERCQAIPGIDQVALTIPQGPEDDPLADWAVDHGIACHRGQVPILGTAANDCLTAYQVAARALNADLIVRVTADEPVLDPSVAGWLLMMAQDVMTVTGRASAFVSNVVPHRTYPDGLDVEVMSRDLLDWCAGAAMDPADREHVTPWLQRHVEAGTRGLTEDLSHVRWTVDTPEDLVKLRKIAAHLPPGAFTLADTRKAAEVAGVWP